MRFSAYVLVVVLLLGAMPACEVIGVNDGEVLARSIGSSLFVTNRTDARIYYFAVGRETAALINWAPQLNPERSVARGATALIRHSDIHRSEEEKEAIVYWWHAGEGDGQLPEVDAIQSVVVRL